MALVSMVAGCGAGQRQTSPPTTRPAPSAATCPLTDLPPPDGKVPERPALAVKVDNLPVARPPYGLGTADVVYEQPVEGGITRFIAIWQCRDAARIEPVRSARFVDPDLVRQFGAHPLFGYAGAIPPVVTAIANSPLVDVGVSRAPNAYSRDPDRQAPHNLVTSTAKLYEAGAAQDSKDPAPRPVFHYGRLADHRKAAAVNIAYPASELTWTWQAHPRRWLRSYAGAGPAALGGGGDITATNIVVLKVVLHPSRYVDTNGVPQNLITLTGSGPAQVFRDGAVVDGRWERPNLSDLTKLVDANGQVIRLTPGETWIELVPTDVSVTVTP